MRLRRGNLNSEIMLRITSHPCESRLPRRTFLQAGALGVGGLTLVELLKLQAAGAAAKSSDTSVILLWLSGGPGHVET